MTSFLKKWVLEIQFYLLANLNFFLGIYPSNKALLLHMHYAACQIKPLLIKQTLVIEIIQMPA